MPESKRRVGVSHIYVVRQCLILVRMPKPVSLNVDDLYDWWDDALRMAEARAWVTGNKVRVFAAGDLWAVQEVMPA